VNSVGSGFLGVQLGRAQAGGDPFELRRRPRTADLEQPELLGAQTRRPKYILNLLKSIITVSLETMKVVDGLHSLK